MIILLKITIKSHQQVLLLDVFEFYLLSNSLLFSFKAVLTKKIQTFSFMNRRLQIPQKSTKVDPLNISNQSPSKKSRNVPAQIWLKRNVLKKLTIQLKFDKNSTNQYRKFRQQFDESSNIEQIKQTNYQNCLRKLSENNFVTPINKKSMRKLSNAKAQNLTKYTDNFFASKQFSINGLKSYHYKSSAFQGNNFINVSKVSLIQKNKNQKKAQSASYRKRSQSQRNTQQQENNNNQFKHKRSYSHFSNLQIGREQNKKHHDFFKVTSKELHFGNMENFLADITKANKNILAPRFKTQPKPEIKAFETQLKPKTKINKIQIQLQNRNVRPKSCVIKPKKNNQFANCEGWITRKSARQQQQPFLSLFS